MCIRDRNVHVANDKEIVILDSGGNATNATVMKNDGSNEFTLKQGSTTHLTMNSSGATFVGDVTGQVSSIVNHSVTDLADVTDAGSGAIITGAERTKLTNATNNSTASTLVERDGSGDFSANIITASNVVSTVNGTVSYTHLTLPTNREV